MEEEGEGAEEEDRRPPELEEGDQGQGSQGQGGAGARRVAGKGYLQGK